MERKHGRRTQFHSLLHRGPAAAFDLAFGAASSPVYAKPHDLVLSAEGRHLDVAGTGNSRIVRYRIVG